MLPGRTQGSLDWALHALAILSLAAFDPLHASQDVAGAAAQQATLRYVPVHERVEDPSCVPQYAMEQGPRPGFPCLPRVEPYPYTTLTPWRLALGRRVVAALSTDLLDEEACGGFEVTPMGVTCLKAMSYSGVVGMSFGIQKRDPWSEHMSARWGAPTKLFDCYGPAKLTGPMAGTAPNGTGPGGCTHVAGPCYQANYQISRVCLGARSYSVGPTRKRLRFEPLLSHLKGRERLSVHLHFDRSGGAWSSLGQLLRHKDAMDTIRTMDILLPFTDVRPTDGPEIRNMVEQERLERRVLMLETLLQTFRIVGSTLEIDRQRWIRERPCAPGLWCSEPTVHLNSAPLEEVYVSFVHHALLAPTTHIGADSADALGSGGAVVDHSENETAAAAVEGTMVNETAVVDGKMVNETWVDEKDAALSGGSGEEGEVVDAVEAPPPHISITSPMLSQPAAAPAEPDGPEQTAPAPPPPPTSASSVVPAALAEASGQGQPACLYSGTDAKGARAGPPCLPPVMPWPFAANTEWRADLGERVLAAVTPQIVEEMCEAFVLVADFAWCRKAMASAGAVAALAEAAPLGLSFGMGARDWWSEEHTNRLRIPCSLLACAAPEAFATLPLLGGRNGTASCQGVQGACYELPYTVDRACLTADELKGRLRDRHRLSTHLHLGTASRSGAADAAAGPAGGGTRTAWEALRWLVSSEVDQDRLRSLDVEVDFDCEAQAPRSELRAQVQILERLLRKFWAVGSTLEALRQGWNLVAACPPGAACTEPCIHTEGGVSMARFTVSYVSKQLAR